MCGANPEAGGRVLGLKMIGRDVGGSSRYGS